MGAARIQTIRLPLQIGTSSLWSLARTTVFFPGLFVLGFGCYLGWKLLDWEQVGLGIAGAVAVTGGVMVFYAVRHMVLALRERPSDVLLDERGLRIEGGRRHGLSLAWADVDPDSCKLERSVEKRFVLWRLLPNLPLMLLSMVVEGDLTIGFTEDVPVTRLFVAKHSGKKLMLAEGDTPIEVASLETLFQAIRSSRWYGDRPPRKETKREAKKRRRAAERPKETARREVEEAPRAILCGACGAPSAPSSSKEVTCPFCGASVAMPEDVRERVEAASTLARARRSGLARLERLLASQPAAPRAAVTIALAAIPIALAWPVAGYFMARELAGVPGGTRLAQLAAFPLLLTFATFLLARATLTDRFALRAVVVGFGARDPQKPGEPYRCRVCSGALPAAKDTPVVRCVYCDKDNVIGLDVRRDSEEVAEEERSLEASLDQRGRERALWTLGSVAAIGLFALSWYTLFGSFAAPHHVAHEAGKAARPPHSR